MVFWILLAIAVIAIVWTIVYYTLDDGIGFGLVSGFLAAVLSGIVLLIYSAIVIFAIPAQQLSSTPYKYDLQAMGTDSRTEGRVGGGIFVVSGYINEKQVFSYIRDNGDGGKVLRQAPAEDSTIYEGPVDPTVEFETNVYGNPFWHPFKNEVNQNFVFTVPDGSVSTQIEVTP